MGKPTLMNICFLGNPMPEGVLSTYKYIIINHCAQFANKLIALFCMGD